MLDTVIRPLINPPLNAAGIWLNRQGIGANAVTMLGLGVAVMAALAIATSNFGLGFALIVANRLIDGLDGAVARASSPTDFGGFFDILADYVFYASVPLAFAVADPAANAIPAAALLAAFCLTCSSFLGFAAIAARRGLETQAHGRKAFFYSTGLVEGTETVVFLLVMAAAPGWFAPLAWMFAAMCLLTALQRLLLARRLFC